jgi:formylglycine-generating enzyme required for sulfatase activity
MNVHERVRFIRVLAFVVAALWIAAVGPLLLKSEYWVNQVKTAYRGHCWQSAFGWLQLVCQRKENKLDSDDESQTLFETTVLPPPAPTRSFALPPGSNASNIAAGEPDRPISATRPGGDTALVSARAPHPLSTLEEKTLKTMDRFVECEMCPEMVVMPEGNFMMGSQANEPGRRSQEGPQHRVMIVERFAIGRFSVTFDEWSACLSEGGCNGYVPSDQGWGRAWQPVINVSWKDAKAFVDWISRKTGRRYRLPSEGEREYVARAGTTTPFSWGRSISTLRGNYNGNSDYAGGPKGEYRQRTVRVDSFGPNSWGLFQLHGNIWEWVEDCWNNTYSGAPSTGQPWSTGDCSRRVLRGGSWKNHPRLLRSASRDNDELAAHYASVGFRIARALAP